jgi:hypothetical protein
VKDFAADDETATGTASQGNKKNRIRSHARPKLGLPQGGHIGVIVDGHRQARAFAEPIGQGKLGPSVNLMGTRNAPGTPVDRAAKPDSDGCGVVRGDQLGQGAGNLVPDPGATASPVDGKPATRQDHARGRPGDQLQFGSPNFNSEQIHEVIFSSSFIGLR